MSRSKLDNKYCSVCGRQLSVSDTHPNTCEGCTRDIDAIDDIEEMFVHLTLQEEACSACIITNCKTNCLYHE